MKLVAWAVLGALLFFAVACGDDDTDATDVGTAVSDVAGAQSDVCDGIAQLDSALEDAGNLNASSTLDEADEVQSDIESAVQSIREAASDIPDAIVNALQTAYEALSDTIENLSGDDTLGDAASSLSALVSAIRAAFQSVESEAGCS
jgi:ElaB/YqjD/DUF883 family membrane-anchored ribosome-binding protein